MTPGVRGICLTMLCAGSALSQTVPPSLSAAARDTLQQLVESAREAGLPTEPLLAKAAEGALKGANDARILHALRTLLRELRAARSTLPRDASTGTLVAAASAIHAGVSPAGVRRVAIATAGDGDLGLALITLSDLVASRVPTGVAVSAIVDLMERRAGDAELTALRLGVADDVGAGRLPEEALRERTGDVRRLIETRGDGRSIRPPPG